MKSELENIIKRAVEKAMNGGWDFFGHALACEGGIKVELLRLSRKPPKYTIGYEYREGERTFRGTEHLISVLCDRDFLKILVGDEMVCKICKGTAEKVALEGEIPMWLCKVCGKSPTLCSPKHFLLAERIFRLLYNGNEEEAIKELNKHI